MSGGERKKRISQGTGWEEAGGEFYQECYPGGELDLEALPRDPHYFATLLPSKQTRAATNRRPRVDNKATYKRRTATRNRTSTRNRNTMAQNTMPNDIHVAMMPDLSENLANEETTWEEMMLIKSMPITMAQKKEIKAKLLSADTFRLQGLKQFKWQRRKLWEYLKIRRKEIFKVIEFWRKCLIKIEGNFGTGVVAFFLFIKWLMFLNLTITALIISCVMLPTLLLTDSEADPCPSLNETLGEECCARTYRNSWNNFTMNPYSLLQGSGWIESTLMYYGYYPSSTLESVLINYNFPLAYIATGLGYFFISLLSIVNRAANGFKERLVETDGQYYRYCTLIFSGWEHCIYNESSARTKHHAIYNEIKESLESERRKDERRNRSRNESFRLISVRLFVNSVFVIIIAAVGSSILFAVDYSFTELQKEFEDDLYRLLMEFTPSICIVGLNLIFPCILNHLVSWEDYSPVFSLRITFVRTVMLRLSTIIVLFASFNSLIKCPKVPTSACSVPSCQRPVCWETFVGQQIYKLLVFDIFTNAIITFFINFPRMLIAKHLKCTLTRVLCAQEFELPKHVLDIVYSQTLIWFGSFYAPFLPALGTFSLFILFYIKKVACLINSSPSTTIYRASRSDSMFMCVLLVSYCVAFIPWAYIITELEPSKSCGPFRDRPSVWSVVEEIYGGFPAWILYCIEVITSSTFAVPAIFVLLLVVYYLYIISRANKQMIHVLKKQLVLEGHDKQFLLNRLSAFIKQHQDRHKAARSIDPPSSEL